MILAIRSGQVLSSRPASVHTSVCAKGTTTRCPAAWSRSLPRSCPFRPRTLHVDVEQRDAYPPPLPPNLIGRAVEEILIGGAHFEHLHVMSKGTAKPMRTAKRSGLRRRRWRGGALLYRYRAAFLSHCELYYRIMETPDRAFSRTTIAAVAGTALSASRVWGANDRVRMGLIGSGGRGREDWGNFLKQPEVEPVAVCDVYDPLPRTGHRADRGPRQAVQGFPPRAGGERYRRGDCGRRPIIGTR